jgi:hypothetical protein
MLICKNFALKARSSICKVPIQVPPFIKMEPWVYKYIRTLSPQPSRFDDFSLVIDQNKRSGGNSDVEEYLDYD